MQKTILLTGATDGIGLIVAEKLAKQGHKLLIHGRNPEKLAAVKSKLVELSKEQNIAIYQADFSKLFEVKALSEQIISQCDSLDVIINNAGILKAPQPIVDGLDIRFTVNTLAPYLLTQNLQPLLSGNSRIVNLSSAAQAPVSIAALEGRQNAGDDMSAYAQSKLALTIWNRVMAKQNPQGPIFIAVNPGSLLASKMVKEGFGIAGKDINIGADILVEAALSPKFADASGLYFDNDIGDFGNPHSDALDDIKCANVVAAIEGVLSRL